MVRKPSRETQMSQSDPAAHAIATSAGHRPNRRAAHQIASTPTTPSAAAVPRSVTTEGPSQRNAAATMYANHASRPPSS
jgi:hypothetical protein